MIINPTQPLLPKEMMRPRPMSHTTHKLTPMRNSRPNRIKPTRTQPPHRHTPHIQLRPTGHIPQHTIPQPIRRLRICRVRRTIRRPGDLDDNRRPAAGQDLVRALAVVRPVPVQSRHKQDDGDAVRRRGFLRYADVERDGSAVCAGGVRVWDGFFD